MSCLRITFDPISNMFDFLLLVWWNSFYRQIVYAWKVFLKYSAVCVLSRFSHVGLCATPWTLSHQGFPRNPPGKNPGAGCHALLQGTFPTEGPNPRLLQLLHCRRNLYHRIVREALCLSLNSFEVQTYFSFFLSVDNGVSGVGSSVKGNAERLPEKHLDLDPKHPWPSTQRKICLNTLLTRRLL